MPLAEAPTGIESGCRDDFCAITHAHWFASDEAAACIGLVLQQAPAALTGLYQAERTQLSGLSAQAVTLYSMAVAYSAAVAAVWSSGKFEVSSDWSQR